MGIRFLSKWKYAAALIVFAAVAQTSATTDAQMALPVDTHIAVPRTAMQKVPARQTDRFDTLAGPLPRVVKAGARPYLVITDIEVPATKSVTIEPGAIFLFKNFAGLHVQGRLIAEGTGLQPIVFTSEFDRAHVPGSQRYANPYDWDGIYINNEGFGTRMSHCIIDYSVYGLVSETKFIRLEQIRFHNNGKPFAMIDNVEYPARDAPFNYVLSSTDAVKDGIPVDILKDPLAPKRNTFRTLGLTLFLGGAAMGVVEFDRTLKSQRAVEWLQDKPKEQRVIDGDSLKTFTDAQQKRDRNLLLTGVGCLAAIIGAIGFSWTFSF
jgi:hypothetical protein